MYKIVVDSDALIKLAKSGLLREVATRAHLFVSERVYEEVVVKGKEGMYEDALLVEQLVQEGGIRKMKTQATEEAGLAGGEHTSLQLFRQTKAAAIASDDQRFFSFLETEGVPFLVPSQMIARLAQKRRISTQSALTGLKRIRPLIREDAYHEALNMIGGEDI